MKVGSEVKCHRVNTVQPPGGELTRGFLLFQTGRLSGPFLASGWRVARGAGSRQAPPLFPSAVSSGRAPPLRSQSPVWWVLLVVLTRLPSVPSLLRLS